METLLNIQDLRVNFYTYRGVVKALNGVSLIINKGESVGLVGETGCGKSVSARAIIKLIDFPGRIESGKIYLDGRDLLTLSESQMKYVRGRQISFIFQEPKKGLDPTSKIGDQIEEAIRIARSISKKEARDIVPDILKQVGLADIDRIMKSYSFELSGGMAQRAMIGMAICGRPKLIIADEPTSSLDVSVQAQIIRLLDQLAEKFDSSLLLITHDLGLAAENCEKIAVMYAGNIVEFGPVEKVFNNPTHPYTRGLLRALPTPESDTLFSIPGMVPDLIFPPPGCRFSTRCERKGDGCTTEFPPLVEFDKDHFAACFYPCF
ncbi:MAG: ABC transporter ATP-binding protein [Deltaproteobacteria bacterium]|nr:ABC transporter ATP-binding protein [Deltaproteobacteria bacterium]MBW2308817.1 ABC transporter ATP-binding protein [Deltaproteobacteria bacterium]